MVTVTQTMQESLIRMKGIVAALLSTNISTLKLAVGSAFKACAHAHAHDR
jgi:hypothetical protein